MPEFITKETVRKVVLKYIEHGEYRAYDSSINFNYAGLIFSITKSPFLLGWKVEVRRACLLEAEIEEYFNNFIIESFCGFSYWGWEVYPAFYNITNKEKFEQEAEEQKRKQLEKDKKKAELDKKQAIINSEQTIILERLGKIEV